jgi:hypothetical protein
VGRRLWGDNTPGLSGSGGRTSCAVIDYRCRLSGRIAPSRYCPGANRRVGWRQGAPLSLGVATWSDVLRRGPAGRERGGSVAGPRLGDR